MAFRSGSNLTSTVSVLELAPLGTPGAPCTYLQSNRIKTSSTVEEAV